MEMTQKLYLPISKESVVQLNDQELFGATLGGLSTLELCAYFLLHQLHKLDKPKLTVPYIANLMLQLITAAKQVQGGDKEAFLEEVKAAIGQTDWAYSLSLATANTAPIDFLAQETISKLCIDSYIPNDFISTQAVEVDKRQDIILPELSRFGLDLGRDQLRILADMKAGVDENILLEGLAGTGKTFLIRMLLQMLAKKNVPSSQILMLTASARQLRATRESVPSNVTGLHFGSLLNKIMASGSSLLLSWDMKKAALQILERDNLQSTGYREGQNSSISNECINTVARFCESTDAQIMPHHLPHQYHENSNSLFRQSSQNAVKLLNEARLHWTSILLQLAYGKSSTLERLHHRVKIADLTGASLPKEYSHIIVDEAHNLSKAMMRIVERGEQVVWCLGDENQGTYRFSRNDREIVRHRSMSESLRAGKQLAEIINPVLISLSKASIGLLEGYRDRSGTVEIYEKGNVPLPPASTLIGKTAILVNDEFALFEWAQKLSQKGIAFHLLSKVDDTNGFNSFVQAVIGLYRNGFKPKHPYIDRFNSVDELLNHFGDYLPFRRTHEILNRPDGYQLKHWQQTMRNLRSKEPTYYLGMLEDSRSCEFETLMLTPDVMDVDWERKGRYDASHKSNIYLALTRPRSHLLMPVGLRRWVENLKRDGRVQL